MHTLTMEGLLGAGTNAKLVNTPMRAAGEAERKGDRAAMERALGYAGAVTEQAESYQEKAAKGMEKEAEEKKETAEKLQETLIEKRTQEREEREERTQGTLAKANPTAEPTDLLELSEEGKQISFGNGAKAPEVSGTEESSPIELGGSVYTAAGEIVSAPEPGGELSTLA